MHIIARVEGKVFVLAMQSQECQSYNAVGNPVAVRMHFRDVASTRAGGEFVGVCRAFVSLTRADVVRVLVIFGVIRTAESE